MSDLQEHHSVGMADEERGGSSRWEDPRRQNLESEAAHPSTSAMNPFLVEMTNCEEDYFNTQEVLH